MFTSRKDKYVNYGSFDTSTPLIKNKTRETRETPATNGWGASMVTYIGSFFLVAPKKTCEADRALVNRLRN